MEHCPACGTRGEPFRTADLIDQDLAEASAFRRASGRKDLKLMHDDGIDVSSCPACGTLWRADARWWDGVEDAYRHDGYDGDVVALFHDQERRQFEADERFLRRHGVGPGRSVLEIGCYVGGFLAAAADMGAIALGVDLNPQMVGWCRQLGLSAELGKVDSVARPDDGFDAMWILNCFEQHPRPHELLRRAAELVRPGGWLVVRTPSADFVRSAYADALGGRRQREAKLLGLWGVPHLACYSTSALVAMMAAHGFTDPALRPRPGDARRARLAVPPWVDTTAVAAPGRPAVAA